MPTPRKKNVRCSGRARADAPDRLDGLRRHDTVADAEPKATAATISEKPITIIRD